MERHAKMPPLDMGRVEPYSSSPRSPTPKRRSSSSLFSKITPRFRAISPLSSDSESNSSNTNSPSGCYLSYEKYEILNQIAKGHEAKIYRVLVDGMIVCMKRLEVNYSSKNCVNELLNEYNLYYMIPPHPNVVSFLHKLHNKDEICLFMTLYDMNLLEYIRGKDQDLTYNEVVNILLPIAKGLEFLHANFILHRDIKADNIFLFVDDDYNINKIVIGDLDTSFYMKFYFAKDPIGTPGFIAPEVLEINKNYDFKADIFSFGMLIYQLLTKKFPYYDLRTPQEISQAVLAGKKPSLLNREFDKDITELYYNCIEKDPNNRPSSKDLVRKLNNMKENIINRNKI